MSAAAPVRRYLQPGAFETPDGVSAYNEFQQETIDAIQELLSAVGGRKLGCIFMSPSSGNAVLKISWNGNQAPREVWCTDIERVDAAAITAAYSMTWSLLDGGDQSRLGLIGGYISAQFQGLPASTQFRASLRWA